MDKRKIGVNSKDRLNILITSAIGLNFVSLKLTHAKASVLNVLKKGFVGTVDMSQTWITHNHLSSVNEVRL